MPTYAVVNGENPGPLQHPAVTLVGPDGAPWDASENIPPDTLVEVDGHTANSILAASGATSLADLSMAASTMLARLAAGDIVAATPAQIKTLLAIAQADVSGLVADLALKAAAADLVTSLWIYPARATRGTPVQGGVTSSGGSVERGAPVWLFDAASDETVHGTALLGHPWATVDVDIFWTNTVASSGDVKWQATIQGGLSDGDSVLGTIQTGVVVAAPASIGVVKVTTLTTGIAVVRDEMLQVSIMRDADDVADTLANDAALFGIRLRKAT